MPPKRKRMDTPNLKREEAEEDVFNIVERLVQPIAIIAEMSKIGDADQVRFHELIKVLLASLVDLGETISQDKIDAIAGQSKSGAMDNLITEVARIIFDLRDSLSSSASSISGRKTNMASMDKFADGQATAIFITQNQFNYAINHVATVRRWQDKVNLEVVTKAAKKENMLRIRELIYALEQGIEGRE